MRIEHFQRRSADYLPAARCAYRVTACLLTGNADAARRYFQPGHIAARRGYALIHAAQIRKARTEANHIYKIFRRCMDLYYLIDGKMIILGHEFDIRSVFSAVAYGNFHYIGFFSSAACVFPCNRQDNPLPAAMPIYLCFPPLFSLQTDCNTPQGSYTT